MLHVTTEVGKSGIHDREKRHFPDVHNQKGSPKYKPRGRLPIPHGYGDEDEWRPHNQHKHPYYTEVGPDWKSKLRYISSPENVDYVVENWPTPWYPLRTYPSSHSKSKKEYAFYPDPPGGFNVAKRCLFDGSHMRTIESHEEISHSTLYGKHKKVDDSRGDLPYASLGDKSYQVVEYSPDFHTGGSTRPVVDFGGNQQEKADTFVPLQALPPIPRDNFRVKERIRLRDSEVDDVRGLEMWRPATPLVQIGVPHDLLSK